MRIAIFHFKNFQFNTLRHRSKNLANFHDFARIGAAHWTPLIDGPQTP